MGEFCFPPCGLGMKVGGSIERKKLLPFAKAALFGVGG